MRGPCLFKERDVKRAARAVLAMGLHIRRVEINKHGTIVVVPVQPNDSETLAGEDEWDVVR